MLEMFYFKSCLIHLIDKHKTLTQIHDIEIDVEINNKIFSSMLCVRRIRTTKLFIQ